MAKLLLSAVIRAEGLSSCLRPRDTVYALMSMARISKGNRRDSHGTKGFKDRATPSLSSSECLLAITNNHSTSLNTDSGEIKERGLIRSLQNAFHGGGAFKTTICSARHHMQEVKSSA